MKSRNIIRDFPIFTVAILLAGAFAALTAVKGNKIIAIAEAAVIVALLVFTLIFYIATKKKKQKLVMRLTRGLNFAGGEDSADFPIPVLVTDDKGKLLWNNQLFETVISENVDYTDLKNVIESRSETLRDAETSGVNLKIEDKLFTVFSQKSESNKIILYFIDNTKYREVMDTFMSTRPAVMLIAIDGMDDIERNYRDSESAAIRSEIENMIEAWLQEYDCMKTKRGENSFAIVTQMSDINSMAEKRFNILDMVRDYTFRDEPMNITLSIGVGADGGIYRSERQAKQSLEMAFGRGGDQAAVKRSEEYEFFGGVSQSVERQTGVKSRIVSKAFCQTLEDCDRVIIMGHRFPDLDALGSGFGIAAVSRAYGREAYIVTDEKTALSKPLLDYMKENDFGEYIISLDEAKKLITQNTVVVITDTHVRGFMEFPEIAEMASKKVVIDHHRKTVNYIDDALIFHLDPSASSASELVAKLIKFLPKKVKIGSVVADALLSGIMLDTKNFVLRAGVDTFEAAAFLKAEGADTVRVKKLFADSINQYKIKSKIVSDAEIYKNCAISVCNEESDEIRIAAAQAADELLNIKGTDASFVVFKTAGGASISARSLGAVNVQLIMEALGGGGHQTMAAAQFKEESTDQVYKKLISEIDKK
ncbi:MAG: DHH family phosphoesterase [Clostridia bacterium]|nr:DHH family phosphoesterase [Clostridia bacterium]